MCTNLLGNVVLGEQFLSRLVLQLLQVGKPWLQQFGRPLLSLLLLILIASGFYAVIQSVLEGWEMDTLTVRQLYYTRFFHPARPSPIVLISVDQSTVSKAQEYLGAQWYREAFAHVVRYFNAAPPRAVVFDFSLNAGNIKDRQQASLDLIESLKGSKNIISALMFELKYNPDADFSKFPPEVQQKLAESMIEVQGLAQSPVHNAVWHYPGFFPPYRDLILKTNMAFFTATSFAGNRFDKDKFVQFWHPFAQVQGAEPQQLVPSLTLGAVLGSERHLRLSQEGILSWPGHRVYLGSSEFPITKWYGNQALHPVYPEISFWDFFLSVMAQEYQYPDANNKDICHSLPLPAHPRYQAQRFAGQYILVGKTAENDFDTHPTIFDNENGRKYPGVYIHANQLDNILRDDFVTLAPLWLNIVCFLSVLMLSLYIAVRFKPVIALLGGIALVAAYGVVTYYAYANLNLWVNFVYPVTAAVVVYVLIYALKYWWADQKRQQLRFAFGKYVSPGAMAMIEKNPDQIHLGGQRKELTILFCDIRGFTHYSENHSPEEVEAFLRNFFRVMNKIILQDCYGSVNKLMGDAIMAYWGFPIDTDNHAFLSVCAAIKMRDAIFSLRALYADDPDLSRLQIGIGINTGEVIIGNVGSEEFMDFTLIGDTVNLASRLESLNKTYQTTIIISEQTYQQIKEWVAVSPIDEVTVPGRTQSVMVYEVLGLKELAPV